MMDSHREEIIENDFGELRGLFGPAKVHAKLAWYSLTRPMMNWRWRRALLPTLGTDPVFKRIDMFLNGEGGMFKEYAYELCERFSPLSGASVLVPGVGYAKNLMQLAAFRPKEILAFDLFGYPDTWKMVAEEAKSNFGVQVIFLEGGFDVVPPERKGTFDFVISDAVLEHVTGMSKFVEASWEFLKANGIFYASFGPLWYGPSGDHVDWGTNEIFDHLLLSKSKYENQKQERSGAFKSRDSCDAGFMFEHGLFSCLRVSEYLEEFDRRGFKMLDLRAKVSPAAFQLLESHPQLHALLDEKNVPAIDRFLSGMYIWAQKNEDTRHWRHGVYR